MERGELERMNAASVVVELCDLIDAGATDRAHDLARSRISSAPARAIAFPVAPHAAGAGGFEGAKVRGLTQSERTRICHRDGFIDRLSPERFRLVYPGAIRALSLLLEGAIDTRVTKGTVRSYTGNAPLWWGLWPTVDHVRARANGGANEPDNLACVSWWRNATKGAAPLDATGWRLQEGGDPEVWDGLLGWFVTQVHRRPELGQDPMVPTYLRAADGVGGHRVDPALLAAAPAVSY